MYAYALLKSEDSFVVLALYAMVNMGKRDFILSPSNS